MNITVERSAILTLELDETEANWLKGYVQNNMFEAESEYSNLKREELFNTLKKGLEL